MVVEKARFIEVTNYSLYDLIAVNKNTHHWILNVDYFQRTKNSNYVITSWIININNQHNRVPGRAGLTTTIINIVSKGYVVDLCGQISP